MLETQHNPDVLNCIANLSNDEVFTSPELVNEILDNLEIAWKSANGQENIWSNKKITFLDPFTKSGVFLREITKRLIEGLIDEIPDLEDRVDHILTNQIFGIAVTELTSLISRRTLYCSKDANGKFSVAKSFDDSNGNIWFERTEHTWIGGIKSYSVDPISGREKEILINRRCKYCNARENEYKRDETLETHAYAFIHTDEIEDTIKEKFGKDMKFDVVIGNPPYQLGSDGGTRDVPIYQYFVEQAKKLSPRFISMVIPARWMATGLGLNDFRENMLNDERIRSLTIFDVSKEVFPSVEVKGGICYFLWQEETKGKCAVTNVRDGIHTGPNLRVLNDFDIFVRNNESLKILERVLNKEEDSITSILSVDKEFGWTSNYTDFSQSKRKGYVPLYYIRKGKRSVGYKSRKEITKSADLIDYWKVLIPKAGSDGGQRIPDYVLGKSLIVGSPSVCTQSYLFLN